MSRIHEALKKAETERSTVLAPTPAAEAVAPPETEYLGGTGLIESPMIGAEIAEPLNISVLQSRCPKSNWTLDSSSVLFVNPEERSRENEEFRSLRSRLNQIRDRQPLQVLLVSSPSLGDGKSFVAVNLAQCIVQQKGKKVLLVDADLRRSRLHQVLGASPSPGLTDFLRGETDALSIFQRGANESLFFVAAGGQVPNPVELIGNGRLKSFLQRCAPLFDWIILDSPPAVPLADAGLLAEMSDGALLVARSGSTRYDLAQKARHQLGEQRVLGVVLNKIDPKSNHTGYYAYTEHPR